ncbi:MAG: purine-nucleoside phosphorylase [Elusimicrobia bacterium]|nr:purine-nucleoside phosphorylase [Elusimicrobiota bacterium]
MLKKIEESKDYILSKIKSSPKTALIAGSGLGNIKDSIEDQIVIPYSEIPNFKTSTVQGHKGELIIGKLNGVDIFFFNGRIHYYEGYTMQEISFPVRVLKSLGIENLIITCAVGAINKDYNPGDIVVIKDHINFMGDNPLIGTHYNDFGERFPDMSNIYYKAFRDKIKKIAEQENIEVQEGTYFAVSGPSYETPAEVSAFGKLGGDVVGMSLIPESIPACQTGIKVAAITYISNKASGLSKEKLSHEEVLAIGENASIKMGTIIKQFVLQI